MDKPLTIAIVLVLLAFLLVFIIVKNQKDKKELEEKIKEDYPKPLHHSNDPENSENKEI